MDINRVLVLRTVSNYDREAPGSNAADEPEADGDWKLSGLSCSRSKQRKPSATKLCAISSSTGPSASPRFPDPSRSERKMKSELDYAAMLAVALAEARKGLAEGGIPIGAAIFDARGQLVASGHNRRVQNGDPSMHGETDAFRNAGRQRNYRDLIMVTTLAPCWYCSGLVRQFGFGTVVVGESRNFQGGIEWLRSLGVGVIDLDSRRMRIASGRLHSRAFRSMERRHWAGMSGH